MLTLIDWLVTLERRADLLREAEQERLGRLVHSSPTVPNTDKARPARSDIPASIELPCCLKAGA